MHLKWFSLWRIFLSVNWHKKEIFQKFLYSGQVTCVRVYTMIENKAKKFHLNENSGIKWKKSDAEIANYQLLSSSQWWVVDCWLKAIFFGIGTNLAWHLLSKVSLSKFPRTPSLSVVIPKYVSSSLVRKLPNRRSKIISTCLGLLRIVI